MPIIKNKEITYATYKKINTWNTLKITKFVIKKQP